MKLKHSNNSIASPHQFKNRRTSLLSPSRTVHLSETRFRRRFSRRAATAVGFHSQAIRWCARACTRYGSVKYPIPGTQHRWRMRASGRGSVGFTGKQIDYSLAATFKCGNAKFFADVPWTEHVCLNIVAIAVRKTKINCENVMIYKTWDYSHRIPLSRWVTQPSHPRSSWTWGVRKSSFETLRPFANLRTPRVFATVSQSSTPKRAILSKLAYKARPKFLTLSFGKTGEYR